MLDKNWEIQLQQLRAELILMKESIKETSEEIIKEGFSNFPIFIAHQDPIELGEVILDKDDMATQWSVSASTLEQFIEKGLIKKEREEFFRESYKDPKEFICMFVIYKAQANFVFVPYKAEALENKDQPKP